MHKKKIKVVLEVVDTISVHCPETTQYMKENRKKVCEREKLTVEELFHFVVFCNVCLY